MSLAPAGTLRRVPVELEPRRYEVRIGPAQLAGLAGAIAAVAPKARVAIVTDRTVGALHLDRARSSLGSAGTLLGTVEVEAGEQSKSYASLAAVCDQLLGLGVERGDVVVALGGGVVGDLAGFAAAILRRGVRVVQVPTTLLAQVDAAIGGKTGINSVHGKNLIGAFHQPSLVLADTDLLDTLPERQFRAGYAEVAKYGLLGDADFFAWLERNWSGVFRNGPERLRAIETSVQAKAAIVAEDEQETGRRALLNLGHTFGHALEAHAGYSDRLLHGEAVAIGMALAFDLSAELALCPKGDARRVRSHLAAVGLPTSIRDLAGDRPTTERLLGLMAQDKKVQGGRLTFILARRIGDAFVTRDVEPARVAGFLAAELAAAA